jgi:hypothetical protein
MFTRILEILGLQKKIIKIPSKYSQNLEIYQHHGKTLLDSPHANYSYGTLYYAFDWAFQQIPFQDFIIKKILLLGLGAGCILELLPKYIGQNVDYQIDAIEIDETVIQIAHQYFDIQRFPNLKIIHADAQYFLENNHTLYDWVIVDLFIDLHMPDFLFEKKYIEILQNTVQPGGMLLVNTLPEVQDNDLIINELRLKGKLEILERYKDMNEMLFWKKL